MSSWFVAFRLSEQELRKLDRLAERTNRDRSKVLRLLLNAAEVSERPDISVAPLEDACREASTPSTASARVDAPSP